MAAFIGASDTVIADAGTGLQALELANMQNEDIIQCIGELCAADMETSGILASVSLAQFILESGYGKSELAQMANNCFGMKCSLSGNTWDGSAWDGVSEYTKETQEYVDGSYVTVTADFRAYPDVETSISDHSAYLLGAKNGSSLRYDGLKGEKDYKKAVQIIKDGGYATAPDYVDKVCDIIERYSLTDYDGKSDSENQSAEWYRVRISWADAKSQIGAFHDIANAKACADANPGYAVFDETGSQLYPENVSEPYLVRVKINDLNMRLDATIDAVSVGYIPVGTYTIVEEKNGKVSKNGTEGLWGRLKSEQTYDGKSVPVWICLSYAEKI
ncbi:MAG: glucosaminidase domain-containing protein [Ruminococcus sp.]|nr:glucosaminidase domain-containing protein [Ruminococcus sp.]